MKLVFSSDSDNVNKDRYWFVELSDGKQVYEDTIAGEESTWRRLRKYLDMKDLEIRKLCLKNKQQIVTLDRDDEFDGFFFCKREAVVVGSKGFVYHGIGRTKEDEIYVTWYGDGPYNQKKEILSRISYNEFTKQNSDYTPCILRYPKNEISVNNDSKDPA